MQSHSATPEELPAPADHYSNRDFRFERPAWNAEACMHCGRCITTCPDGAIIERDDNSCAFLMRYCKGCGICAGQCPTRAITMTPERERPVWLAKI